MTAGGVRPRGLAAMGGERLVWAAAIGLAAIQAALLVRGYRIAPDDAMFYAFALSGWDAAREETLNVAMNQGRIGAFVIIPINIAAAYLSDHLAFRWFCAGLFLLTFAIFALWAARVFAAPCASAIFLVLVALNVTDYFHFAPVSFPLQNTIPFLAILAARLMLVRPTGPARRKIPWPIALPGMALFVTGMLATEYGFLLGSSMLAFEMARHLLWSAGHVRPRFRVIARRFAGDIAACLLVLMAYVAWRLGHPSSYDGNQMASLTRLPQGTATALAHILVPFALPYANVFRPLPFPAWPWALAALAPGIIGGVGFRVAQRQFAAIGGPLAVAGVAAACAVYVVFPVAMTLKQQERCFERYGCAFLDSQIAYLWIGLAMAAVAGWLVARPGGERTALILSVLFGIATAAAFYNNKRLTDDMRRIADVWDGARIGVCAIETPAPLAAYFDPESRAAMHAEVDREAFWSLYRDHHRPGCPPAQ